MLAAGGDLSPERLQDAYRRGIFPWYADGQPILWWSPDPRMVLFVDDFKVARSLRKTVAQNRFDIRVDTDFRGVLEALRGAARRAGRYVDHHGDDARVQATARAAVRRIRSRRGGTIGWSADCTA